MDTKVNITCICGLQTVGIMHKNGTISYQCNRCKRKAEQIPVMKGKLEYEPITKPDTKGD